MAKLIELNRATCVPQINVPMKLSVSKRSQFRMSKTLVEAMKLKDGDGVTLWCDAAHPKAWYIRLDKEGGLPLRYTKKGDTYRFTSSVAGDTFLKTIGWKRPSCIIPVGDALMANGHKAWPLLIEQIVGTSTKD